MFSGRYSGLRHMRMCDQYTIGSKSKRNCPRPGSNWRSPDIPTYWLDHTEGNMRPAL